LKQAIGIFGGTFDPVHYGHLRTAWELRSLLDLAELRFMPCAQPPLKAAARASGPQRVAMLEAAISRYDGFAVDQRELSREGPSYTVDTLRELRDELPDTPLCLIIGMDAWRSFTHWERWQDILDLSHIVVAHRPGNTLPQGELADIYQSRAAADADQLHSVLAGSIYIHEVTQLEISSSAIRNLITDGLGYEFLLPPEVGELISSSGCYLPE